jgi:GTP cyclohydrolase II
MHQEGKKTANCQTPPTQERTAPPGLREYGLGAQILTDLGLTTVRLLTNHPQRIVALEGYGLKVIGDVPI